MEQHAGELHKNRVISIEEYLGKRKRLREEKTETQKTRGTLEEPTEARALVFAELYM